MLQLRNQYGTVITKVHSLCKFPLFLPVALFLSRGPFKDTTWHLVVMATSLGLLLRTLMQTFPVRMTLTASRITGQTLCRMPYCWNLSDVLLIRPVLRAIGRKTAEATCRLYCVISSVCPMNMIYDNDVFHKHLTKSLSGFSITQFLLSPLFPYYTL